MKVCSVDEIRALDRAAIEEYGISEELLMENAGQAVYSVILKEFGIEAKRFLVFCGTGNNGGDGVVVARKLSSAGGDVKVVILGDQNRFRGSSKKNFEILSRMDVDIRVIKSSEGVESLRCDISVSDVIVDAIFGTGLTRDVGGIYREVIELINESGKKVVSVDIPSGINGDNGRMMGVAVRADYTVTFGLPKIGNILYPGYEYCGRLYLSYISFPPQLYNMESIRTEINEPVPLPPRRRDGHKGTFGKALFIAGAFGYFGAPYLSAMSFLKAGGGYSRLAAPKSIIPFIACMGSEIVFNPLEETESGSIALGNKERLLDLCELVDIVILGPGLSLNEETQELVRELTVETDKPLIIDGDGITAVSKDSTVIKSRRAESILTPHLVEMSRLTGKRVDEIEEDKIGVLRDATDALNAIIILKGAHSLIGYPDGKVYINMSGNSGMATAGSGDVLTGTIAAMYGLGLSIEEASRIGVFIHGLSGDLAAMEKGEDGITAQDILNYLPFAMKNYRERFKEIKEKYSISTI